MVLSPGVGAPGGSGFPGGPASGWSLLGGVGSPSAGVLVGSGWFGGGVLGGPSGGVGVPHPWGGVRGVLAGLASSRLVCVYTCPGEEISRQALQRTRSSHWRAGQSGTEEHVLFTLPLGCSPELCREGGPLHAPTGVQARRRSGQTAAESDAAREAAAEAAAERAVAEDVLPRECSRGRVAGRRLQRARSRSAGFRRTWQQRVRCCS